MIKKDDLIAIFQQMYREHWAYEWGAARRGCVDCSGAFVYAFRQLGGSIYHGSNTIARRYVGPIGDTPVPGYAAFRWKKKDTEKYPDGRGDFYHIGLVDEDGKHVLNAKGTKYGFSRDSVDGWRFAPLNGVTYSEDETGGDPMPMYWAVVETQSGGLRLRSGPGTNYKILFTLPKGTEVLVIEDCGNGWVKVDEDGEQGYVSKKYLKRKEPESPAPDPPLAGEILPEAADPSGPAEELGVVLGVFIPCDSQEEALRYAGNIKGAILVRGEKPPGA